MSASANINTHTTLMINLYIGAVWLPHRSQEWKPAYSDAFREGKECNYSMVQYQSVLPGVKCIWTKWHFGKV